MAPVVAENVKNQETLSKLKGGGKEEEIRKSGKEAVCESKWSENRVARASTTFKAIRRENRRNQRGSSSLESATLDVPSIVSLDGSYGYF